jgi:hypothetical protein
MHALRASSSPLLPVTDSAHSISTRGAYRELHEFLTRFLVAAWGAGGLRRFDGQAGHRVTRRALAEASQERRDEERQARDIAAVHEHVALQRRIVDRAGRDP